MPTRQEREEIARTRILRVLAKHGIATARTLEQKISDAGPYGQRIDPHILTSVRNALVNEGALQRGRHANAPWYSAGNAPGGFVKERLELQLPVYQAFTNGAFSMRLGQTLEIATYRAFLETDIEFYGRFKDLAAHDDSTTYSKEEPPQHRGRRHLDGQERLDFTVQHPDAGLLGIEIKNVREWLYPHQLEVREALRKCVTLDCVPVIIGRRIPYVTFMLLSTCGVIFHQTYNQLIPATDAALADQARNKELLGYHDLRTGNTPDARLRKFIGTNLMAVAKDARTRYAEYRDILEPFAFGEMGYSEFAARIRRRSKGQNENHDWEDEPQDGDE